MTTNVDSVALTGDEIARGLLEGLERSRLAAADTPIDLVVALGIALRSAHLLGALQVERAADQLPPNIRALLEAPEPKIETKHARIEEHEYLGLVDLLDLLSDERLECVAPRLHRGWQDKTQSCREARAAVSEQLDESIGAGTREALMGAVAIHRRGLGVPGPIELDASKLREALRQVLDLVLRLGSSKSADELTAAVAAIQEQLA